MRTPWSLAAIVAALGLAGSARAQQPMNPYGGAPDAPPPAAAPDAQPINPYGVAPAPPAPEYPPPAAYGYQPPTPGRYQSTPPSYQQGYYLYAAPGQPPVYYAPPPAVYVRPQLTCAQLCAQRRVHRWDGVRRFSLGVHGTVLGVSQKVGGNDVVLGGAGFQLRLRSKGRFGFEASQSFLHAEYWNGGFSRDSYPFAMSLMFYIFPNEDSRHFNLYGVAGVGSMPDSVRIRFQPGDYRSQDFLEWTAHAGLGAELRFKWFAIEADARILGTVLDKTDVPATYYNNVAGGPIPDSGWAWQGNVYVSLWF